MRMLQLFLCAAFITPLAQSDVVCKYPDGFSSSLVEITSGCSFGSSSIQKILLQTILRFS